MQHTYSFYTLFFLCSFQLLTAQNPTKKNAVAIYQDVQKLNYLGSVLYIAAHPDDENTRLLSYLSKEQKARTGYLSLTRGDGGQNLIGTELRELLGAIRTQELIEARKIDGAEQFFTRANDFGFSKNPTETLEIWDKEKVLSDIVWAIRKFKPDIIINRFDHRSPGTTHGHHTASAILSVESFNLSADSTIFPEQLNYVEPWQAKQQFFNHSWWFYGSLEKFNVADKTNLLSLDTGVYYPALGQSNQEIAALSRSCHQSQGFGTMSTRGQETEYLEFINGNISKDQKSLFEGIDTTWNRVKGGKKVGELLQKIQEEFNYSNPAASLPNLATAYSLIQKLDDTYWVPLKLAEIKEIIAACAGLYLEVGAKNPEATPGSKLQVKVEAINRSSQSIQLINLIVLPENLKIIKNIDLKNNVLTNIDLELQVPETLHYTQPYWLQEASTLGMYSVKNPNNRGIPDIIRELKVVFTIKISPIEIPYERAVVYKYTDEVKGEKYNYLDIVPDVTTSILNKIVLFKDNKNKTIAVQIKAGKDVIKGILQLQLPKNWQVTPKEIPFEINNKATEKVVYFKVTPPNKTDEIVAQSVAIIDKKIFDKEQIFINYDHISRQQILKSSQAKLIKTDLKTNKERIGYIMRAGDEVPKSLIQMGYSVVLLKPEEITAKKLDSFDAVITGIRAYNTLTALAYKQALLFDFVKKGKKMIVQYNTSGELVTQTIAPYPLQLSRDRVTEENATVRFLAPNHPVLNFPNKLNPTDFQGWKQEQGLYYPNEFDKAFVPILSSNDTAESPKNGALLIAPYGKGYYIYTGLSFFRQLPQGVTGAYKLFSNIISLK